MIVACQKCDTRFQLDDARVPLGGVKVRCSRCRHAFHVAPAEAAGASDGEVAAELALDAAVASAPEMDKTQALETLAPDAPDAAEDRTAALDAPAAEEATRLLGEPLDEEADWQFNEDPAEPAAADDTASPGAPPPAADPEPLLGDPGGFLSGEPAPAGEPTPEVAEPGPEPTPDLDSDADPMSAFLRGEGDDADEPDAALSELGDPEEWDLLGSRDATRSAPEVAADAEPAVAPVEATDDAVPDEVPAAAPRRGVARRALAGVGWLAILALAATAAWRNLVPASRVPPAGRRSVEVAGLRAEDVRWSVVENAIGGPLYVVSGSLRNPHTGPRVAAAPISVRLVDREGVPIPSARALVAPAPREGRLRTAAPEVLAEGQLQTGARLVDLPLAPGEAIAFAAMFAELPDEAHGFRFEAEAPLSSPGASPPPPRPSPE